LKSTIDIRVSNEMSTISVDKSGDKFPFSYFYSVKLTKR
jgi:hypothetical protein